MRLADISLGDRIRQDMGDLRSLADSIRRHGLLHPIVVKKDGTLVAGHRRIEAVRLLGWNEIAATEIDVEDLLSAERDENTERKDFTPTEAVAIGRLIEEIERPRADKAKRLNIAHAGRLRYGRDSGESPPSKVGDVRDIAAKAVGMSSFTYQRAKNIVKAAEADPEKYGDLPAQMDETNVMGTHRELERRGGARKRKPTKLRSAVHGRAPYPKFNEMMQRAVNALDGLCLGLKDVELDKLDPIKAPGWSDALKEAATFLSRLARRVADVKAA